VTDAVVFDLDGLLLDTEQVWDEVREALTRERGGRWHDRAQADMMGMSSTEWSRYMHDTLGLSEPPEELNRHVVERMQERYRERLPLVDGAIVAVRRIGGRWPLGLASSSNRELIDLALELMGVADHFRATVSSE
jgi:beta-phosphoglucomutase-like phosphatase (HAD superfamily)